MRKSFFIWTALVITLIFVAIIIIKNSTGVYAQGYCAPQRVINQWSCKREQINVCDLAKSKWGSCSDLCSEGFSCNRNTSYKCQVVNYNAPCTSSPCQTTNPENDCADGATWESSCATFGSQNRGCWVYPDVTPTPGSGPTPTPGGGGGGCGQCGGCFANSRVPACPDNFPSNAGQGVCAVGEHACCQPACPGSDPTPTPGGPTPTPAPCTIPAPPTLLSPPANAVIPGITTFLNWYQSDWGNCPGSKRFGVFIDLCGNLPAIPNGITSVSSYSFTGISGQSYCWTVDAIKGIYASFKAPIRRFTFQALTPTSTPTPTPTSTPTPTPTPAICSVATSPSVLNLDIGQTAKVSASVTSGLGSATISRMRFGSYDTNIAAVNPASDSNSPYSTMTTGIASGSTAVWGSADLSDGRTCQSSGSTDTDVNVSGPTPTPTPTPTITLTLTPTPTPTLTPTPTPVKITVNGTIYDDPAGDAAPSLLTGKCFVSGTYGESKKPGEGNIKVLINPDGRDGPVEGNGSYQVNQVVETGPKTIAMQDYDLQYQCTCPTGCQYGSAVVSGGSNSGWDFFVSQIRPRWLKVFGGSAHVQGNLIDNVPSGNVFIADSSGDGPGALTKNSGSTVNFGSGSLSSQPLWNYNDQLSAGAWKYGYRAMWLRAGNPSTDPGDGGSAPAAGEVYRKTGDWAILGGGGWSNLSGSRVIFIEGNVTINGNITLGNGGFLAIVASGNITVDPSVGNTTPKANPTSADANLVGAFFANGNFAAGTTGAQTDKQLVIYGSVAADAELNGAGSVSSQRDLGVGNASPGVAFIWNPFLILNAPQPFTDAVMDWKEVAP